MSWVDYDQHARTRPRNDVWGQVRRTVRGLPVGPEQIEMIVTAIRGKLELQPDDVLLDLACGNGALSVRLHEHCRASLGVDISPYMIEVARERFETDPHRFVTGDVRSYAENEPDALRFTKALCYGSLSYVPDPDVAALFATLRSRFTNVGRVMLGNLPDPANAALFFSRRAPELR